VFGTNSRYAGLDTAVATVPDADGGTRDVRYVRRRFVPQAGDATTLAEHLLAQGDRLDTVTARYLGDPTQFWRVCDANTAMNPPDLTAPPRVGTTLLIPVPRV